MAIKLVATEPGHYVETLISKVLNVNWQAWVKPTPKFGGIITCTIWQKNWYPAKLAKVYYNDPF